MKHTIKNSLVLYTDNEWIYSAMVTQGYEEQEFVSKEIAQELAEALISAEIQIKYLHKKFKETGTGNGTLAKINRALKNATE